MDGGDFRFTLKGGIFGLLFAIVIVALWFATRRLSDPMLRFAILFSAVFGGITALYFWKGLSFLPQPNRYQLEMDPGPVSYTHLDVYKRQVSGRNEKATGKTRLA